MATRSRRVSFPVLMSSLDVETRRGLFNLEVRKKVKLHFLAGERGEDRKDYYSTVDGEGELLVDLTVTDQPTIEGICFLLQSTGELSARRLRRLYHLRGFTFNKNKVNPLLHTNEKVFFVARVENATPFWKCKTAERNSFDDLVDLAKEQGASLFTSPMSTMPSHHGTRCAFSIVWSDNHGEVACTGPSRTSELEARVDAAHLLMERLADVRLPLHNRLLGLHKLAYERGMELRRGTTWHQPETEFLEFKGAAEATDTWNVQAALNSIRSLLPKNFCAFVNTNSLQRTSFDGVMVFGVHDATRRIQGIVMECASRDYKEEEMKLRERFRDYASQVLQSIKGPDGSPICLDNMDMELLRVDPNSPDNSNKYDDDNSNNNDDDDNNSSNNSSNDNDNNETVEFFFVLVITLKATYGSASCKHGGVRYRRRAAPAKAETVKCTDAEELSLLTL
eukprot:TRINITY_DN965_c0_g1_i6.p1 TRINITY_DN965_c0_g1~~TRINITY_DN965_c0_g1_i6.p1  ORF type:complete len:450 (+),score=118.49 TRINITY_DN965_c0_g1_i6:508-1857(+)